MPPKKDAAAKASDKADSHGLSPAELRLCVIVYKHMESAPDLDWSAVAAAYGYRDGPLARAKWTLSQRKHKIGGGDTSDKADKGEKDINGEMAEAGEGPMTPIKSPKAKAVKAPGAGTKRKAAGDDVEMTSPVKATPRKRASKATDKGKSAKEAVEPEGKATEQEDGKRSLKETAMVLAKAAAELSDGEIIDSVEATAEEI